MRDKFISYAERHGSGSTHGQNHKRLQRAKALAMRQHVGRSLKPIVRILVLFGFRLFEIAGSGCMGMEYRRPRVAARS